MSLSEVLNAQHLALPAWHSAAQLHSHSVLLFYFPVLLKILR